MTDEVRHKVINDIVTTKDDQHRDELLNDLGKVYADAHADMVKSINDDLRRHGDVPYFDASLVMAGEHIDVRR